MKNLLLLILILLSIRAQAQERFFKLLEGWHCQQIYERHNKYYSIGLGEDNLGNYNFQFNRISLDGIIDSTWILDLPQYIDESYPFNDAVTTDNNQILVGGVAYDSLLNRSAIYLTFNDDFTQNIKVVDLNLGYNSMTYTPHIKSNGHKVMGRTYQVGGGGTDVVAQLLEVNENDSLLWIKSFFPVNVTNTDWLQPRQLLATIDNGYLFVCTELHLYSLGTYSQRPVLIKTNSQGVQQWRRYVGDANYLCEGGYTVPSPDGGWLVAWGAPSTAGTNSETNYSDGLRIEKINANGTTEWLRDYGSYFASVSERVNYYPKQITALADGNFLVAGHSQIGYFLFKFTATGDPIWYRYNRDPFAADNNVFYAGAKLYSATPTSDGGFICAGEYLSDPGGLFPNFVQSAFAMKLDEYGCLEPGCQVADAVEEVDINTAATITISPNPSTGLYYINQSSDAPLLVYDINGQLLQHYAPHTAQIDLSHLAAGLYILSIGTDKQRLIKL